MEVVLFQQAYMVESALDHGLGHGGTILGQDVLFEAAAIDADTDGHALLVAGIGHSLDAVVVADVAGVDANFIGTGIQRGQRGAVVKMDVSHDGDVDGLFNGGHHGGVRRTGHCDADDLAACSGYALGLGYVARNILDRDVQHRLYGDGVGTANFNIADFDFSFQLTCHLFFLLTRIG